MEGIIWWVGFSFAGLVGFLFGVRCAWWGYMDDIYNIKNDVFDIIYDWGVHPDKKVPPVFRLKRLDKYFDLDEIREGRGEHEEIISEPRICVDPTIADRVRKVEKSEWVV